MDFNTAIANLCGNDFAAGVSEPAQYHEDVLTALLPASRTDDGRVAIGAAPRALDAVALLLRERRIHSKTIGALAVRLLRNLCARSPPNQRRLADMQAHILVIERVGDAFEALGATSADGKGHHNAQPRQAEPVNGAAATSSSLRQSERFFTVSVEFLCNFVTGNAENANHVWKAIFPEKLFDILESGILPAEAAGAALMHNCIAVLPQRASDLARLWNEAQGNGKSIAGILVKGLQEDDESDSSKLEERNDAVDEKLSWSFMVIRRLVASGLCEDVFSVIGSSLDLIQSDDLIAFSPYQVTLLSILDAATGKSAERGGKDDSAFVIPDQSLPFFARLLSVAWEKRDGTMFRLASSISGSILLLSPSSENVTEFKMTTTSLAVQALIDLHSEAHDPKSSKLSSMNSVYGVRGTAIRVVALSCDRDKAIQDAVRKKGGLIPVLSALSYEKDVDRNPFLREWSIIAVRNLCHGNQENASEIANLELVDVQTSNDVLDRAGLEAYMDAELGRPRLRVKS